MAPVTIRHMALACGVAVAGLIGTLAPAGAQTYPSRAITLVVGFSRCSNHGRPRLLETG